MSKELIERLRTETFPDLILLDDAAYRIMELERELRVKDATIGQMANDMAAAQAQIKVLRDALENCRLLAARYRKEEWAPHILRFCESGGSVANPLRQDDSALQAAIAEYKQDAERYRFFIEHLDITDQLTPLHILMSKIGDRTPTKVELDAAIDSARGDSK